MLKSNQNKNNLFIISAQERLGVVQKERKGNVYCYWHRLSAKIELKNIDIVDIAKKKTISCIPTIFFSILGIDRISMLKLNRK